MHTATPPLMTDELPLRIEAEELAGAEQFRVTSKVEIQRLAMQLAEHHELVCIYVDSTDRFGLSSMLAVDERSLTLDMPSGALRHEIAAATTLSCVSTLQRVKLQFDCEAVEIIEWQGQPALKVRLPDSVLRIQRRDFYRLTVPLGNPLSCFFPTGHGEDFEVSLVDVSVGGIGILGYVPGLRLTAGTIYHSVRIELPDAGTVVADVEIRSSYNVTLRNGIKTVRTGGQFINLPGPMQSMVQRYITRVERERIARAMP